MAWYPARGGGIPASVKTDMNSVLNKKFGTSGQTYPPKEWAEDVNLMGLLPIRTASGSVAHFEDGAEDVPMKSVTANITPIQSGTGTPSPSNPRPISGTSVLNVKQIQNQLIYATAEDSGTISGIAWSFSNGYLKLNGTTTAAVTLTFNLSDNVNLNPSDNRILFNNNAANSGVLVYFRRGTTNVHYWGMNPADRIGINWTDTGNENVDNVMVSITPNNTLNNFAVFPCLMLKTEEPTTTPVSLGRTIYGGSVEAIGGTGSDTHKLINLADLTWTLQNGAFYSQPLADAKAVTDAQIFNGFSSHFVSVSYNYLYAKVADNSIAQSSSKRIYIYSSAITTLEQLETAIADAQLAYELATPTDFTFDGVRVESLEGVNNVWTEAEETAVEYRADIDLLIAELEG